MNENMNEGMEQDETVAAPVEETPAESDSAPEIAPSTPMDDEGMELDTNTPTEEPMVTPEAPAEEGAEDQAV